MLSKKKAMFSMSCLICIIFSGCRDFYTEQYYPTTQQIIAQNNARYEREKREAIEKIAPLVAESKTIVEQYSTEVMKAHISRGELVIGMNLCEVMLSLSVTDFKYGVPYRDDKYTGVFGTVETFYIGGFNPRYVSSNPKYILTFTDNILTSIYEP